MQTPISNLLNSLLGAMPIVEPRLLSGGTPSAESLGADSIRVLTWNLHKQTHPFWRRDFDRILDKCRPHILNLQEARTDLMRAALSARPESWAWMASPNLTFPGSRTEAGVFTALLSPPGHGSAMLSEAAEPLIRTRKAMLRCETPTRRAGIPLMCLNIHSLNFKLGLAGFRDQLERLLEKAGAHRGPVILSGDFNTWSGGRRDLLLRMTESSHLRRVDFPADAGSAWWKPRLILDHVFHSHRSLKLKPGSAKILDSIRSSDHSPLLAEFVLD